MNFFRKNFWFFMVIFVGLIVRLYHIDLPLLDAKPHREIHTAEETRNLYYDHELLYPKAKLWADEPGYYLAEFPLYNEVVASVYHLTHSVNETWGRIVSVISSVGVVFVLYLFIVELFGPSIALVAAVFFYIFSPQEIILSRSFQPDQFGLFFGITSVYFFLQWTKKRHMEDYILSFLCFTITLLVKVQFFSFGAPIAYLAYATWKKKIFIKPLLYLYGLSFVPFLLWWHHIKAVYEAFPHLHSAPLLNPSDWIDFTLLTQPKWYVSIAYDFTEQVITLPVLLLALLGIFMRGYKHKGLFYFWFCGLILYALLFVGKIYFWYYQVPFLFPIVILAGSSAVVVYNKLKSVIIAPKLFALIIIIAAAVATARPYLLRTYAVADRHRAVLQTAHFVKTNARQNAKVITSSYNSAALTYYSLRPDMWGATFDMNQTACTAQCTIEQFQKLRDWGGQLYAISDKSEFSRNPIFRDYLTDTFPVLFETKDSVVYELTTQ